MIGPRVSQASCGLRAEATEPLELPELFDGPQGLTRQMTCEGDPQAACVEPPNLPYYPPGLAPTPSLVRSETVWGQTFDIPRVFDGTPYLPMTPDEQALFELSPTPDPSRILVGLSKPTKYYKPTPLETQMWVGPLDGALDILLAAQPAQSAIVYAASFNNYCIGLEQNFLSQRRDQSERELLGSAPAGLSRCPALVSSRSIFADPN